MGRYITELGQSWSFGVSKIYPYIILTGMVTLLSLLICSVPICKMGAEQGILFQMPGKSCMEKTSWGFENINPKFTVFILLLL